MQQDAQQILINLKHGISLLEIMMTLHVLSYRHLLHFFRVTVCMILLALIKFLLWQNVTPIAIALQTVLSSIMMLLIKNVGIIHRNAKVKAMTHLSTLIDLLT
jgi:hypothetical protein